MHESKNIKLTICIPTFNRYKLLKDLVDDIESQEIYVNYEILILNDGHESSQINTCKNLEKKYQSVRYIQNHKNLGLFKSLELNFKQIKGEYVIFPGDDDKLHEGLLDREANILDNNPEVSLVAPCFNLIYTKENISIPKILPWDSEDTYKIFDGVEIAIDYLTTQEKMDKDYTFVWPSILFRKDILLETGHFKGSTKIAGDSMVIVKALSHGKYCQIRDIMFDFINYGGALRELNSSNGTVFYERIEMLNETKKHIINCDKCDPRIKSYNFDKFEKALAEHAFSLNGPAVWIASRHKGSYPDRVKQIIRMFIDCIEYNPKLLIKVKTYIVLFASILLPSKAFFHLAKYFQYIKV